MTNIDKLRSPSQAIFVVPHSRLLPLKKGAVSLTEELLLGPSHDPVTAGETENISESQFGSH
jgi:hypothetical protein